jgi:hypothetical protein
MAKSLLPKHIALRICKTLYELKGGELHWVDLKEVCTRLDEVHNKAMNAGLEYGREHDLLSCGPLPVHSVMLTHKGLLAARGKFKKSHRESG